MEEKKKIAMSIAGSDPSSGAGLQADLKAFTLLGIHGVTVVTCVTVQNTKQVKKIHKLPVEIIEKQIDVLLEDMQPDAVKTGMLYDDEIVRCVANKIRRYKMKAVVDPVMVATSGDTLSEEKLVGAIKKELISRAYVLTPNLEEARVLTGISIETVDDVKNACVELYKMGSKYVFIKGGHFEGRYAQDVFFNGEDFTVFSLPRLPGRKAHGSGCALSALITGYLALGEPPVEAAGRAKHMLWNMINEGYKPGVGADVLNYSQNVVVDVPQLFSSDEYFNVWLDLKNAVDKLLSFLPREFIPEVGINIGYALPETKKLEDICAIDGRIIKTQDKQVRCGRIDFGVSKHVASIILAAMNFNSDIRSVMNLKYSEVNLEKCKKIGFKVGYFDRLQEPKEEMSTMEWGTSQAIKQLGSMPDIIYDTGGKGKEPMIRILGKNPREVVGKVYKLLKKP